MVETNEFVELGLTKNESRAYETLIKFGKLSAGEVSSHSGVSYSRIYDILNSLIRKGLVEVVPEKTKKFIPSSPQALLNLIENKEKILQKTREKVKEMKEFYKVKEKNPVIMGIGQQAFYRLVKNMKDAKKFEYAIKWSSEFRPEWVRNSKNKRKRGVDLKALARYDIETQENVKKWLKIEKNTKRFENEGVAVDIRDNNEVLISLIKSNVTIVIKDTAFGKIMKQLFLDSYKSAEPIK